MGGKALSRSGGQQVEVVDPDARIAWPRVEGLGRGHLALPEFQEASEEGMARASHPPYPIVCLINTLLPCRESHGSRPWAP